MSGVRSARPYALVAIEGPDAAGKSSLARRLCAAPTSTLTRLAPQMDAVFRVLEAERTGGDQHFKDLVPSSLRHAVYLIEAAIQFRYLADCLERFELVVADRWLQSWEVHCGDRRPCRVVSQMASYVPVPDLLIYLRVSPEVALDRLVAREDRAMPVGQGRARLLDELTRQCEAYDEVMIGVDCFTIDADAPEEVVADEAAAALELVQASRAGIPSRGLEQSSKPLDGK